MLFKTKITTICIFLFILAMAAKGQRVKHYNLVKLLRENKLDTTSGPETLILDDAKKQAISTKGIVWLKGVNFKDGAIDADLRGKDVFLESFLGTAFHAKDTAAYDLIYFRPFRFHSNDIPTRKWSVQYVSMPGFDYDILRKDHPGVYENTVNPVPQAGDWFHVTITIKGGLVKVYVNHSATASLVFKALGKLTDGMVGLWSSAGALSGDFANLSISE